MVKIKMNLWRGITFIALLILGCLPILTSCAGTSSNAHLAPQSSNQIEVRGTVTEVAGSNISLNTGAKPLVLKFNSSTIVTKQDATQGTIGDIRVGMPVRITYDPTNFLSLKILIE